VALIAAAGVPTAPIYGVDKISKDPHFSDARKMFIHADHPIAGNIVLTGNQIKMSDTPTEVRMPPPMLGEHTHGILGEYLGYSEQQIASLTDEGIL
jgi:crotonobetainyl-CoA:carnitine CoA-transferase CaiB-like acyl-CoA transferase